MIVEKLICITKSNLENPKCTLQSVKGKYIDAKKKNYIGTSIVWKVRA